MLVHNCEQNSDAWYRIRLGIPTASEFHRIITPTGKKSSQADGYANQLIAEMMLARSVTSFAGNSWTERGKELEPQAAIEYEITNGIKTELVGFCTDDLHTMGASPDRLVGENGLIEIKCVKPAVMIDYILSQEIDSDFKPQMQGQLLITGREWVDLVPFHPDMPPLAIRVQRDESYIKSLAAYMQDFNELLASKKSKMIELEYMSAA